MPIIGGYGAGVRGLGFERVAAGPIAPAQVAGLVATNLGSGRAFNNGRIDISWTAPSNNGSLITGYFIERSINSGSSWSTLVANTGTTSVSYSDNGLTSEQRYDYRVSAINAGGTGIASTAANATATTVPQAPTIGTATAGNTSATVTYTAGSTGGSAITTFTATSNPGSFTGTGSSPITVNGLTNGTAYTFTVTATNANGTSAVSAASNSITPISPPIPKILGLGGSHTAITYGVSSISGGGAKIWGNNTNGQLGIGNTDTPKLTPMDIPSYTSDVALISGGRSHTCFVTNSGEAKCFGLNSNGQLGDGSTTQRTSPVTPSGLSTGVASISTGEFYTCAVLTSGGLRCWGANADGQLGDGSVTQRISPVTPSGLSTGVASVATGRRHTCAVMTSGELKCWGINTNGQLGLGNTNVQRTPATTIASGVASVALGLTHSCAVMTSGELRCWGTSPGNGLGSQFTSPTTVIASGVASVKSGSGTASTCAVMTSGELRCWGDNTYGQLGTGDTTTTSSPTVIMSGISSVALGGTSASNAHTCAVTTSGELKCWGNNASGQLGLNDTSQRLSPTTVTI